MTKLIEQKMQDLIRLCRLYKVERLDLFGSAAKGSFLSGSSDLDFVVRFADRTPGTYVDRYLDFAEALEDLFDRHVDLLTEAAIRNPYFRREVEATRQLIYEQRNEEAAA